MSRPVGTLEEVINESSGLIRSSDAEFLWTLNDSGDVARIFAIDHHGRLLGEVHIDDAINNDWEAITSDGNGHLLIGDVGNNANRRRDLTIYVVPEPDPSSERVSAIESLHFSYPDQRSFPDDTNLNFDAEALFSWRGRLFLLTKHRSDQNTALYVFPETWDEQPFELVRISEATLGSMVTDAALSPDGEHLAVLTYEGIWIFEAPENGLDFLAEPLKKIGFHTKVTMQCEGLAW
ncbi:MAG: hypothetical protein R3338_14420, partial [Thermoanaerobaculia bacterium]|nr:hypothetical protein [Thermoanaerobaculia bacterium]